jgi:WD40 repeat protein
VSAVHFSRHPAPWLLRPSAAALVSLLAVSALTALVGVAFLPAEMRPASPFSSVTHSVELSDRAAVSLFWSTPQGYAGGRKHYLALHNPSKASSGLDFPWPDLDPLSLAKLPHTDQLVVGTWDGAIYLLDATRLTSESLNIDRHSGGVIALACSTDGKCLVSQGSSDLRAWDLTTSTELWRRTDVAPFCFTLAPDSQTAFIANLVGEAMQIDLHTGRTLHTFTRVSSIIVQLAISPGGDKLAILSSSGRLQMLDVSTGSTLWEQPIQIPAHQAPARVALFSPSGESLVTTSYENGNSLILWDALTGRRLRELHGHYRIVHGGEFTATGELRSWSADGTIRVWDLPTGAMLHAVALQPPLNAT